MSNQFIDPMRCDSLAFLVESIVGSVLSEHAAPICFEMEIDVKLGLPADPEAVARVASSLIRQAVQEMPDGGELAITAVENPQGGVELEIADTGNDVALRPRNHPMAIASIEAELQWLDCPQGGGCVTVIFAPQEKSNVAKDRKAA